MIASFLRYLQYERRYSLHTVGSYNNDLLQFESFLTLASTDLKIESADYQHIRAWIISLVDDGIQPVSVNRKIASLRSFYKFLLQREEISSDPCQRLQPLKSGKKLPQFIQENDINRILDHTDFGDSFSGLRDKLILELFYGTGMRRAELIGLTDADIDLNAGQIKVLGKRNKERILPLSRTLSRQIITYKQAREEQFGLSESPALLLTDKGKPCYPVFVYRVVKKYLGAHLSLDKKSPHVLRHTFATHMLNKGADLNAVKDLLGHSSLAATQVYTHNSLDKLKRVFDQAHPKA